MPLFVWSFFFYVNQSILMVFGWDVACILKKNEMFGVGGTRTRCTGSSLKIAIVEDVCRYSGMIEVHYHLSRDPDI